MEVKGFNKKELEEAFKVAPKILFEYVEALFRVLEMSKETNDKAIAKIKELSKARSNP